jgi:hypothetical protein
MLPVFTLNFIILPSVSGKSIMSQRGGGNGQHYSNLLIRFDFTREKAYILRTCQDFANTPFFVISDCTFDNAFVHPSDHLPSREGQENLAHDLYSAGAKLA